jgi:amino acid transporter
MGKFNMHLSRSEDFGANDSTQSGKFVDPSAAFALGWAYWFSYVITIANELQAVCTVLGFWTDKVPIAAWITIFWVVIILVNVGAVTVFGEVEVVCSTIKFGWIFVVIFSMIGTSSNPSNAGVH